MSRAPPCKVRSLVLNLEDFNCTPHIQLGHGLVRIPYPHVGDLNFWLILRSSIAGQRNEMDDVKLAGHKIVQVKRVVLRVAKDEDNSVPLPNRFAQPEKEEPGRIRRGVGGSEVASGNCNSCDRPLLSGVRILYEDGSLKRDRFLSLPADQRQGDDEHNGDKKSDPSFDFVGTSHLYIINVNMVDISSI